MTAKIFVEEIVARDLQPGDLFTTMPQQYWDYAMNVKGGVGEAVYVRTNISTDRAPDSDTMVFKVVKIEQGDDDDVKHLAS